MNVDLGAIREAGKSVGLIDQRILSIANRLFNRRLEGLRLGSGATLDLEWVLDGGGAAIATQTRQVSFDFPVTISGATIVGPPPPAAVGALTIVVRQYPWANYSAAGQLAMSPATATDGAPALPATDPAYGNTRQFRDAALTRWSLLTLPAGDILELAVTQASVFQAATFVLRMQRTG